MLFLKENIMNGKVSINERTGAVLSLIKDSKNTYFNKGFAGKKATQYLRIR